jgi:hypothetical protein
VFFALNDGAGFQPTGVTFENDTIYELVISMDFARNRWRATLDGNSLVEEQPINTQPVKFDFGDIDAKWVPQDEWFAGDNALVFDEFLFTAEVSELPAIIRGPLSPSVTLGTSVALGVVASGGEPLHYQWRRQGADLPGATNAILTLENVTAGMAGVYDVSVSNWLGTVTSSATLTVSPPAPPHLINCQALPEGGCRFTLSGTPGARYALEVSSDLIRWLEIAVVIAADGTFTFSDATPAPSTMRLYRARYVP